MFCRNTFKFLLTHRFDLPVLNYHNKYYGLCVIKLSLTLSDDVFRKKNNRIKELHLLTMNSENCSFGIFRVDLGHKISCMFQKCPFVERDQLHFLLVFIWEQSLQSRFIDKVFDCLGRTFK